MTPAGKRAVILFAHGSRDPLWHLPIEAVARQMQASNTQLQVRPAYLELSSPSLPDAAQSLVQLGYTHISVVPLFLGVGRHAREDLPRLITQLRVHYPAVVFDLKPAVGEDPRLIRLLASIAAE
ncbi:MAG: CbiX/SirB N-terminal domain-containing protein [Rhodoferax sp.]|nr:CbiX/SirB N-terminal domain-containing protein [Rhodoferax sp.]